MAERTILLRSGREGAPVQKENKTTVAITPGMLIEYVASGTTLCVKPHATAGGSAAAMVAIENSLEGQEIGDAYAISDICQFIHAAPGDELYMMLADDQSIAIGDFLESNGAGYLQESSEEKSELPGSMLFQALEAVLTTTSGNEAGTRIRVVAV